MLLLYDMCRLCLDVLRMCACDDVCMCMIGFVYALRMCAYVVCLNGL